MNNIVRLRNETGVSLAEAKQALLLCGDYDIAKEYLKLRNAGVAQYKLISGAKVPFAEKDYIELAKENIRKAKI